MQTEEPKWIMDQEVQLTITIGELAAVYACCGIAQIVGSVSDERAADVASVMDKLLAARHGWGKLNPKASAALKRMGGSDESHTH